MEIGQASRGLRWMIVGVVLVLAFVASACAGMEELTYLVAGQTAEADVTELSESTTRARRSGTVVEQSLIVSYTFTEPDGTWRHATSKVDADWPLPDGGKVLVQYTPGEKGKSRLAGQSNVFILGVVGFLLVVAVGFGFFLLRVSRTTNQDAEGRSVV